MSLPGHPKGDRPPAQREGSQASAQASVVASPPSLTAAQRIAWRAGSAAWIALLALAVLWEWQLAPLRPGGSWLVLKALPMLLPLRGLLRADKDWFQWALLLVFLYLCEGLVRVFEPMPYAVLAGLEVLLALAFFVAAAVFLRPFKRAALARRQPT